MRVKLAISETVNRPLTLAETCVSVARRIVVAAAESSGLIIDSSGRIRGWLYDDARTRNEGTSSDRRERER